MCCTDFFSVLRTISWSDFFFFFLQALHKSPQVGLFPPLQQCDITQGLCSYSQCKLKLKLCLMTSGITEWPDLLQSSNVSCHCCFSASPATFTFAFYTVWLASTFYPALCCFILYSHAVAAECVDESQETSPGYLLKKKKKNLKKIKHICMTIRTNISTQNMLKCDLHMFLFFLWDSPAS